MPDLNEIVPKSAIESVTKTDTAITKLDESTMKFVQTVEKLSKELKKGGVSFKEIAKAEKSVVTNKNQLTKLEKEQLAAEKALERQRQRGLSQLAKIEAKERELEAAIRKEVKTEQDLINKTNALVAKRKQLDRTTKEGRAEWKRLSREIDKNTKELKQNDAQIGRFQRNVGNYKSAIGGLKLGFIAVAAAIAGATRMIKAWIDAADVQQKAEAKLLTALKGRVDVQQRLMAQATELQGTTLFGDEETINAQSYLAAMGLNESAIKRLIPLVQDLATKNGSDLKSAADLVAKSVGSSTNALSRYGIAIEGDVGSAERLESAIDGLNKQVGGQAVAAAEAGAGAVKQFENAWGDLKEQLGSKLLPTINSLFRVLTQALKSASQVRAEVFASSLAASEQLDVQEFKEYIKRLEEAGVSLDDLSGITERFLQVDRERLALLRDTAGADQYQIEKLEGRIRAIKEFSDIQINGLNLDLSALEDNEQKKTAAVRQGNIDRMEAQTSGLDIAVDADTIATDALIANEKRHTEETEKEIAKRTESHRLSAEERLDIANQSINALSSAGNMFFEFQSQQLAQQTAQFADAKAYELKMAGDNQEEINKINLKYAKKEAELKTQQAKQDKTAAIFRTIINIAQGVVAMFQAGPAGIVLGALTAAIGAASLATIIAQPIPKFAKGTQSAPGGLIEVGERGRELIETKSGQLLMANQPTITSGLKGAKIYSNPETERILKGREVGYDSPDLRKTLERNNEKLIQTIKNKRELHVHPTKPMITERKGSYYKRYFNTKLGI